MTPEEAAQAKEAIEQLLQGLGLWYSISERRKPHLDQITFNEITIKVFKPAP